MQKKMFKVLNAVAKKDVTGTYWMRLGSAFTNKDDSINIYLDAMPKDFKLQLREFDETDARQRESHTANDLLASGRGAGELPHHATTQTGPRPDQIPF